jgi:hypothetical protein
MSKYEILDTTSNWNIIGKPSMVRVARNGIIRFSVLAVKNLGLRLGMKLSFMLPKDDNEIIYIYEDEKGLELNVGNVGKNGASLHCCGRHHAQRMLEHLKINDKYKTFDISKVTTEVNGKKCWFIQKHKIHRPIISRNKGISKVEW